MHPSLGSFRPGRHRAGRLRRMALCVTLALACAVLGRPGSLLQATQAADAAPPTPPTPPATSTLPAATAPAATAGATPDAAAATADPGVKIYTPVNPRALTAAANDMALVPSPIFAPKIQDGELLEYTISVSPTGMIAGSNILRVKKRPLAGDPTAMVYEITSKVRSSRLFDMIYPVKIDVTSLMDMKEGYSQHYNYQGLEGTSQRQERIEMDYTGAQAVAYYYRDVDTGSAHTETKRRVPLPGRVQDPLCALYALRGADMEVGKDIEMTVTTEERNFPLVIKVVGIETIDVADLGKRKCFKMQPVMRFGGLFTRKGKLWFWVDEKTHVPVRLEVEIPVGKAIAVLTRHENSPFDEKTAPAETAPTPTAHAGADGHGESTPFAPPHGAASPANAPATPPTGTTGATGAGGAGQ
ncbi:MAG: DUF3108 domain-containing protein [Planctomycetota bacterium]